MTPPSPPPLPLIIFDCDGVLVDSEPLLQRIDIDMITELGWPITVEEIHAQHLGHTVADVVANIERHIGGPIPDDFLGRRDAQLLRAFETELEPVPGIHFAVDGLAARGYRMCVASSGSHEKMQASLGSVRLYGRFAGRTFSAHDVERGKPAPDLFLYAAGKLGYPPGACVVIEDSPAGIEAARSAGMRSIGYAGDTPRHLLVDADIVIDSMVDLTSAIESVSAADSASGPDTSDS